MPPARRHKWISIWLKDIYRELLVDRISDNSLVLLYKNYFQLQTWLDEPVLPMIPVNDKKGWMEFISNLYHAHKRKTGLGISEHDFLPRVLTGDQDNNTPRIPVIDYKVALDNIRSAFNVGSIYRLIDAVGFKSVIVGGTTPGKEHRQVEKTAMGSSKWIPQESAENLPSILMEHKAKNFQLIGIETVEHSKNYLEYNWPETGIVVLGNEEYGLSKEVIKTCDDFVHIPMHGKKNSVNVANAFAVISFHIAALKNGLIT